MVAPIVFPGLNCRYAAISTTILIILATRTISLSVSGSFVPRAVRGVCCLTYSRLWLAGCSSATYPFTQKHIRGWWIFDEKSTSLFIEYLSSNRWDLPGHAHIIMTLADVFMVVVRPLVFHSYKTSAWSLKASLNLGGWKIITWKIHPMRWGNPAKMVKYCNVIYVWNMDSQSNDPGVLASMVGRHVLIANSNCWWIANEGSSFQPGDVTWCWVCGLLHWLDAVATGGPLHRRTCWTYRAGLYSFLWDQPTFQDSLSAYDRWVWL